jgi:Domain of unknown function (DUF1707)/Cell wall-active antibiotics response 4TMS YvqF
LRRGRRLQIVQAPGTHRGRAGVPSPCLTLMPDTPLPAPPRPAAYPRSRPSDEDRERVAAILSARFADDVLSLDEFEDRVARVYRAATVADLDALVADLAAPPVPSPTAPFAVAAADMVPAHDRRFAVLANLEHHSMTVVPRRLDVAAVLGNVELDLRDAAYGAGETELHVRSVLGNITITLPVGAVVEQRASGILGSIECQPWPAAAGRSGGPIVRLTGHAVLGAVEIRFAERGSAAIGGAAAPPKRVDRGRRRP